MFDDDKKMTIMMWNFTNVLDDWHRNHNVLQKRKAKIRENKIITKKREDKRKRKKQRRQRRARNLHHEDHYDDDHCDNVGKNLKDFSLLTPQPLQPKWKK
jgi:hypothetical protein